MGMKTIQMQSVETKRARRFAGRRPGSLGRFPCHRQVAVDVFNLDGSVVHQNAHGKSETAQRHDVNGLAERAEAENADENRQWDRDGNDQSALPIPEEEQES